MKKLFLRLTLCAALTDLAWSARADSEGHKELIVPGKSIGLAELGPGAQVSKVLGESASGDAAGGRGLEIWYGKPGADGKADSTLVYSSRDESGEYQAREIGVTSAFFHTKKGVSTNSNLMAIWQEFPNLRYASSGSESKGQGDVEIYDDAEGGIAFAIQRAEAPAAGESWGQCCAILVHEKGQESRSYIPRREVPQKTP